MTDLNSNGMTTSTLQLMSSSNGIEVFATVDLQEVERMKHQGWIVESTRLVMGDIVCYNLARLA